MDVRIWLAPHEGRVDFTPLLVPGDESAAALAVVEKAMADFNQHLDQVRAEAVTSHPERPRLERLRAQIVEHEATMAKARQAAADIDTALASATREGLMDAQQLERQLKKQAACNERCRGLVKTLDLQRREIAGLETGIEQAADAARLSAVQETLRRDFMDLQDEQAKLAADVMARVGRLAELKRRIELCTGLADAEYIKARLEGRTVPIECPPGEVVAPAWLPPSPPVEPAPRPAYPSDEWGIIVGDELVERGFVTQEAAKTAATGRRVAEVVQVTGPGVQWTTPASDEPDEEWYVRDGGSLLGPYLTREDAEWDSVPRAGSVVERGARRQPITAPADA